MTHTAMTEADRVEELDRQLSGVEVGLSNTVTCPWCWIINTPGNPACCAVFVEECDKRGVRQFESVLIQHRQVLQGVSTCISCPYCKRHNYIPPAEQHPSEWKRPNVSQWCCDLFAAAVEAIVHRMAMQAGIDKLKRIEDGIEKAAKS